LGRIKLVEYRYKEQIERRNEKMNNSIILKENIFWIGKVDDREVPFHRLTLAKGTTYNSYLLKTGKPTVIDTVDISFGREYVENLKNEIDPNEIKYIVINHTEPDHSGGLPSLAAKAKNAVIICREPAVYELKEMYKLHSREFLIVKDKDILDIGGKTLRFIEVPYLHTEETMMTYCEEDKVLFPCDIFSTHIATYDLFNDLAKEDITEDFKTYYSLIMHPHRKYVQDMLEKVKGMDIEIIAPSHGYILRQDVDKFINIYDEMSRNLEGEKNALILYSTMTGNTKKIANMLKEDLEGAGLRTQITDVNKASEGEIIATIEASNIIFFGSSTRYGDMIGNMEKVLKKLGEMKLEGKICGAFGSYGWSGEAVEVVQDYLKDTNMKVLGTSDIIKSTGMEDVEFPIRIRFSPQENSVNKIEKAAAFAADLVCGR
jgi:flavorubredoxin